MSAGSGPVTFSVVSHGQGHLVTSLLEDLDSLQPRNFDVILTLNIPEVEPTLTGYSFPLRVIRNASPIGFGANHNQAFLHAGRGHFAVVNPDIRLGDLALGILAAPFADREVAICAPAVVDASGAVQDSARRFPTFGSLARRVLSRRRTADYA